MIAIFFRMHVLIVSDFWGSLEDCEMIYLVRLLLFPIQCLPVMSLNLKKVNAVSEVSLNDLDYFSTAEGVSFFKSSYGTLMVPFFTNPKSNLPKSIESLIPNLPPTPLPS